MPYFDGTILQSKTTPYRQKAGEVIAALGSNAHRGLTQQEANRRLQEDGRNELAPEKPIPGWRKFLMQFQDPLVILLLIATAISAGLWLYERESALPYEAIAIVSVVLLNAAMGYIQESRAASAVAALKQMAAAHANVIRDGERRSVAAAEVVAGDIILVEEGDTVPADARVIQSTSLKSAEAALTGKSLPVAKDSTPMLAEVGIGDLDNIIFSGTAATYGRGRAIVVATGMATEMGRIAGILKELPDEPTPLQKELDGVGKMLGVAVVGMAIVMIATIILFEHVQGWSAILDVLILSIALAVAAVPEGLPAVVTAVLSLGVQHMAKRKALVRNLSAVGTLGSANVIASDKTGTLTKNEMTVQTIVTASGRVTFAGTGYAPDGQVQREEGGPVDGFLWTELERTLAIADRANNAVLQHHDGRWSVQGDPTEGALVVAARKAGLTAQRLSGRFERVGEVPFSSERKLMSTLHTDTDRKERLLVLVKGAPDVLLSRCSEELTGENTRPLTDDRRAEIIAVNEELAARALRTLAIAYRSVPAATLDIGGVDERVEQHLIFAGLIRMLDPPRAEAKDAVAQAKRAGIRPIMITGDHPVTAQVIARELGIASNGRAVTGEELQETSDESLVELAKKVSVYARVNPQDKLRIVGRFRAKALSLR